jgi:hypothetical protein
MDKVYLRHLFEENKNFLRQLFEEKSVANTQKLLNNATDSTLNVLVRILYLIANGEISLHESHQEVFKKSKRLGKLSAFESRSYFVQLLHSPRSEKLHVLKQFLKLYPFLLHTFFNI